MATNTTLELVKYYANLLIYQFLGKIKAYKTIQTNSTARIMIQQSQQLMKFSAVPDSGTFIVSYEDVQSSSINWNDSISTIQNKIRTIPALSTVNVTGSFSSGIIIDFVGFINVAEMLVVSQNSLLNSFDNIIITITETDLTLPLAIQNAFDINTAVGVQLNILGKYTGVIRTINTPTRTIVLNDEDFRTLMKFAIVQNNSGSSLAEIENNLNIFFPGKFIVTDYKNMTMSYIISNTIGSADFFAALIQEKYIPRPMAVGISVIAPPVIDNFFGYSLYESNGENVDVKPYNTYEDFNTDWIYLQYQDFIY